MVKHFEDALESRQGIATSEQVKSWLAWLEKQKEQKELPLMNGDADLYFDEWNQQKHNPTKRQCFEEGIIYAQRLQKEPHYTKRNALFDKCVKNCDPKVMKKVSDEIDEMLQKEQKPVEWSDADNIGWDEALACVAHAEITAENEEELQNAVTAEKWLKEIKFKYCVHPVKQEWSEEDEHRVTDAIYFLESAKTHYADISEIEEAIAWLKSLRPQPKQEWSEVELEFRGEKVKVKRPFFRDDKGRGYSTTQQDDEVTWNALRAWAESHGYTPFDLYPREEWSEEDEEVRRQLICVLSGGIALTTKETRSKMLEWLKSLSPSWKPSEDEERLINTSISFLKDFADKGYENAVECIDWLKSKLNGTSTDAK